MYDNSRWPKNVSILQFHNGGWYCYEERLTMLQTHVSGPKDRRSPYYWCSL